MMDTLRIGRRIMSIVRYGQRSEPGMGKGKLNLFFASCAWLVLCLFFLHGCLFQEKDEGRVAQVNGEAITFSEFWEEFKGRNEEVTDPSALPADTLQAMKASVLRDLIRRRLLLQEVQKRGITVPEDVLEARIQEIRKDYKGRMFEKSLLIHQKDYQQWREDIEEQIKLETLYKEVVGGAGEVTDEEIGEYYDYHLDEFLVPETVKMRQILVRNRPLADKIRKQLRKGGDFSQQAQQHSVAPLKETAGRLEAYRRGELPEALEEAAFSAKKGKVTPPVETYYGFHLLLVEEKTHAHLPSLVETRDRIERRLRQKKEEDQYHQWIRALLKGSDIKVHASLKQGILGTGMLR